MIEIEESSGVRGEANTMIEIEELTGGEGRGDGEEGGEADIQIKSKREAWGQHCHVSKTPSEFRWQSKNWKGGSVRWTSLGRPSPGNWRGKAGKEGRKEG
jgi:hypothetical protein